MTIIRIIRPTDPMENQRFSVRILGVPTSDLRRGFVDDADLSSFERQRVRELAALDGDADTISMRDVDLLDRDPTFDWVMDSASEALNGITTALSDPSIARDYAAFARRAIVLIERYSGEPLGLCSREAFDAYVQAVQSFRRHLSEGFEMEVYEDERLPIIHELEQLARYTSPHPHSDVTITEERGDRWRTEWRLGETHLFWGATSVEVRVSLAPEPAVPAWKLSEE
jgi:hypothetical protein